ncbi:hypothetical protein [Fulvivirga sedimenti]|uniref:Uncharacterized protein n=1 Tax=Fulvivirga sedimenti TaxID=2879465 RepID=A0A9X1HRE6_9BACT|nr:hypothetical protein [Fulvivirga sedimenti]MCA6074842.1 hypothetical protein [Fulvivirga sedimenti]MCA6076019.1 hypothetical protein [Fulvivirga sedimenti]MCA6077147.1 hypothetical protein [Fulvivirga sedimenti]
MKTITLIFFGILFSIAVFAQEPGLRIINRESGKEIFIKESKRVRVKNRFGQEFAGRFVVTDRGKISIDGKTIELVNIQEIQRVPILQSALTRGVLIYGGAVVTGIGVLIGAFGNPAGFLLIIPGSAMIYLGVRSKNFNKRYRIEDDWIYELDGAF